MKITDILKKVASGETLTQEETDFAKSYKEGGGIPKDRLDREIEAKKEAEAKLAEAEKEREETKKRLQALEDSKLSEAEKADKEREEEKAAFDRRLKAVEDRERAATERAESLEFNGKVQGLAKTHNVKDVETLQVYAEREKLDFTNEAAVSAFVESQKTTRPDLFKADIKPGPGITPGAKSLPINQMPKTVGEKVAYIKEHGQDKFNEMTDKQSQDRATAFKESQTAAPVATT